MVNDDQGRGGCESATTRCESVASSQYCRKALVRSCYIMNGQCKCALGYTPTETGLRRH